MEIFEQIMPKIGDRLVDRYRIESVLGRGGFGIVYEAWQENLDRRVAIKMLLPMLVADKEAVSRFRREIDLVRRLEHPNTVRIFDRGETAQGLQFFAMEFVDGQSLAEALAEQGPFPPARVARIAEQVLGSLGEAHERGVIHRDLKPGNIVLTDVFGRSDFVKVLDFGIGKLVATGDMTDSFSTGGLMGTPLYMSPEQARQVADLDGRSDLYALGLIMHELCTSRRAIDAPSPLEVIMAHVQPTPVALDPRVAASPLGAIIQRATAKNRDDRFRDASAMLEAIRGLQVDDEVTLEDAGAGLATETSGPSETAPNTPIEPTVRDPVEAPFVPGTPVAAAETATRSTPDGPAERPSRGLLSFAIGLGLLCLILIVWAVGRDGNDTRGGGPPGTEASPGAIAAERPADAPSPWAQRAARQFEAGIVRHCWRNNPVPGVNDANVRIRLTFRAPGATIETIRIDGIEDRAFRRCVITRGQSFPFEGAPDVAELVIRSRLRPGE